MAAFRQVVEPWLGGWTLWGVSIGRWIGLGLAIAIGWTLGWLSGWPARLVLRRIRKRTPSLVWPEDFEKHLTAPIAWLILMATLRATTDLLTVPEPVGGILRKACDVVLMTFAAVLVIRLIAVGKDYLQATLTRHVANPGKIRSITTRLTIPARILQFVVGIAGVALVLLQFRAVQELGMSLLASAGLAGVVVGLAAQRTVSNLLVGLQLAFAEPVRIGDTVVLEGEFGEIEHMGLTHVVVKLWDLRRLVVPVSYFTERPFQNWTMGSSDVIGPVIMYTDFTIPVDEVRAELERVLAATDLWDRKTKVLQVTDLTADRVELRVLVSASDSGRLWNLRCLVREELLAWLQSRGRSYLPVRRVEDVSNHRINGASRSNGVFASADFDGSTRKPR